MYDSEYKVQERKMSFQAFGNDCTSLILGSSLVAEREARQLRFTPNIKIKTLLTKHAMYFALIAIIA